MPCSPIFLLSQREKHSFELPDPRNHLKITQQQAPSINILCIGKTNSGWDQLAYKAQPCSVQARSRPKQEASRLPKVQMIWVRDAHTKTLSSCHKTTHFFRISSSGQHSEVPPPYSTGMPNLARTAKLPPQHIEKPARSQQGMMEDDCKELSSAKQISFIQETLVKDQPSFSLCQKPLTHYTDRYWHFTLLVSHVRAAHLSFCR